MGAFSFRNILFRQVKPANVDRFMSTNCETNFDANKNICLLQAVQLKKVEALCKGYDYETWVVVSCGSLVLSRSGGTSVWAHFRYFSSVRPPFQASNSIFFMALQMPFAGSVVDSTDEVN